jgi:hypothetical protein
LRVGRVLIVVIAVVVILLLVVFAYAYLVAPSSSSQVWATGSSYPLSASDTAGVVGQACINGTAAVYCIGGIDYNGASRNDVYSASVSSTSMGSWVQDSDYPETVGLQSCVSSGGYAYCVGGSYDDAGDDIASSYYAPLTSAGLGTWNATTAFPVAIDSQSCAASSGYVYCIAGENETDGTNATIAASNSAWYAPISSSGIGAWVKTTPYPSAIAFPDCTASSTDVFCVGGLDINGNGVSDVYYATISASGIGTWTSTTAYPFDDYGQTCVIASGNIICVGGVPNGTSSASDSVYSAPISTAGVGSWHQAENYPFGVETACAVAAGNLYCVGGYQDSSAIAYQTYYATVASLLA